MICTIIWGTLACQNDQSVILDQANKVDLKKVAEVRKRTGDEQKNAYLSLNAYEQQYLWKQKIDKFSDTESLSTGQREVFRALAAQLEADLFSPNSSVASRKLFGNKWTSELLKHFTLEQIRPVVAELGSDPDATRSSARGVSSKCNCNGDSIFACSTCGEGGGCSETDRGCGFLFLYNCSGACGITPRTQG